MDNEKQIEGLRNFMLEKSNSANVEPVFTTSEGREITLGQNLTKLLNDVLEQAFIPFLAETLYAENYRKVICCKDCADRDTEECPLTYWNGSELVSDVKDNDFCSGARPKNEKESDA